MRDIVDTGHKKKRRKTRLQALIQEAVGLDLRGCRPGNDRWQAYVRKVGKWHS